ncbi:hypothetical protein Tco_0931048 [Tanacetum coccineum]
MSIPPQGEPSIKQLVNDPRNFAKPVKAISLPQDVPSTSDRRLIELKNQVQRLMESHLAPKPSVQVNKIASSCEICSGPHDTQYCMENPEQAFVDYASSCIDEAGGLVSNFMASQDARLSKFEADFKQQQGEMTNKIETVLKAINDRMTGALPSDTKINKSHNDQTQVKTQTVNENGTPPRKGIKSPSKLLSPKYQSQSSPGEQNKNSTSPKRVHFVNTNTVLSKDDKPGEKGIVKPGTKDDDHDVIVKVTEECKKSKEEGKEEKGDLENINTNPPSPPDPSISFITRKENDEDVMFIELIKKYDESCEEELGEDESKVTGELEVEYFDRFLTRSELAYHKYLMCGPIPYLFLRNPIIVGGCPSNLKIPCNIGHVHVEKAYIDLNSPVNVMTRLQYNWIMRKQLEPREDPEGISGISNFIRRIKGMHIFIGNFTNVSDFMIVEDISSIIDPRLSEVVLGKPFVEISNMTHDLSLGVVKFINGTNEIAYKMPHKIEQYNSLSNLEKKHTKSVYLRNEEDKKRGVEYVINKILGFYKECLELGPEYLTGLEDEGEVT